MPVSLSLKHIVKTFGSFTALRDISLEIHPGELFFLLGPSGCGKTTLLRSIAGFYTPEEGEIQIGDRIVTHLPPHRRDTGMMFQSYALWPHLTLAENVAFGLEMRRIPKTEIKSRVREALRSVHLEDRANARPNQLSGGQQQRVALARALVIRPQCLLLDEPLSNLDAKLRLEMRMDIRRICKESGLTAVYVTHDQKEALSIADRLAVMRGGIIEQVGTPAEVYRTPKNRFVAGFIGEGNFLDGCIIEQNQDTLIAETDYGRFTGKLSPASPKVGSRVSICIRPETIRLDTPPAGAPNVLQSTICEYVYLGEIAQRTLSLPAKKEGISSYPLKSFELNPQSDSHSRGTVVQCWIPPEQIIMTAE